MGRIWSDIQNQYLRTLPQVLLTSVSIWKKTSYIMNKIDKINLLGRLYGYWCLYMEQAHLVVINSQTEDFWVWKWEKSQVFLACISLHRKMVGTSQISQDKSVRKQQERGTEIFSFSLPIFIPSLLTVGDVLDQWYIGCVGSKATAVIYMQHPSNTFSKVTLGKVSDWFSTGMLCGIKRSCSMLLTVGMRSISAV